MLLQYAAAMWAIEYLDRTGTDLYMGIDVNYFLMRHYIFLKDPWLAR